MSSCALPSSVFLYLSSSDHSCGSGANHPVTLPGLSFLLLIFRLNFLPLSTPLLSWLPSSLAQPLLNHLLLCFSRAWLFYFPFSFPSPVYMRALRAASSCALMRVVQIAPVLQLEETLISGAPCCARVHQGQVSPLMLPHAVILLCTVSCVRMVFPQCIL